MPTIKVLAGGGFVEQEVRSETICELREELDISSAASVAVNGSNKGNSYSLQDGDLVAAVSNDKTGGAGRTKTTKPKKATKVKKATKAYRHVNEMAVDAGIVMKNLVDQTGKYDIPTAKTISSLFGNQISLLKEKVNMTKLSQSNNNGDSLSITE